MSESTPLSWSPPCSIQRRHIEQQINLIMQQASDAVMDRLIALAAPGRLCTVEISIRKRIRPVEDVLDEQDAD